MLGVYAACAAILLASLVLGSALLHLLGRAAPTWLSGAVGFAALTVACPLLIRLPGRATTLAILLALLILAAGAYLWLGESVSGPMRLLSGRRRMRRRRGEGLSGTDTGSPWHRRRRREGFNGRDALSSLPASPGIAAIVVVVVVAAASLPFAFNQRDGVLGEGIYTNDQAAQLYWTDWLQNGVGPEPKAVQFGYPTGPQAVAAAAAEATNASLLDAFNGLLLAIPVLTALAALAALEGLPPGQRAVAAALTGLPYLAASFLAQSAFKETAMALLVLAFAVALGELGRRPPAGDRPGHPRRAMLVALLLLTAASLFVYSLPGLVWFAVAIPIWGALELATGGLRVDVAAVRGAVRRHRVAIGAVAIVAVAVAAFSAAQLSGFVDKVGQVQASAGRLSSPVFPGEALGIWPEGDFRIVRGDVTGAYPAVALALVAAAIGALAAFRRRDWGLVAVGASAVIVYAGARLYASIYVEAKALAIMSPLVVLAALSALFPPGAGWGRTGDEGEAARARGDAGPVRGAPVSGPGKLLSGRSRMRLRRREGSNGTDTGGLLTTARYALGGVVALALAASTFLALRAAPVGFDARGQQLESLAGLIPDRTVVFLGVDRFAGYWLRGTLMASPGGYVPSEVPARPTKVWQQGFAMDFDTLFPSRLDDFDYAITTAAAYQSTPLPNFTPVVRTDSYVLWKREGRTPPVGIIDKDGAPGRVLDCATPGARHLSQQPGSATVLPTPVVRERQDWSGTRPFDAPGSATQTLKLGPGRWQLSLQYHSQVPLTISAPGLHDEIPASLEGMYLTKEAQGAFWPAGELHTEHRGPVTITVSAAEPSDFQRLVGVERRVWLGPIAASRPGSRKLPLSDACGRYVDRFLLGR